MENISYTLSIYAAPTMECDAALPAGGHRFSGGGQLSCLATLYRTTIVLHERTRLRPLCRCSPNFEEWGKEWGGSALGANARAHFRYFRWYGGKGGKGQDCPLSVPGETIDPSECPDAHSGTDFAAGVDGYMPSCDGVKELSQSGGHMVTRHSIPGCPRGGEEQPVRVQLYLQFLEGKGRCSHGE